MIETLFLRHPRAVGESYGRHLLVALGFARDLLTAGLACGIHALLPFLFTKTASRTIERLHARLVLHRAASAAAMPAAVADDRVAA